MSRPPVGDYERTVSHALPQTQDSALRDAIAPQVKAHPGESGFYPIGKGKEALTLRLAMAQAAQHSLDIQYYSIQNDITGKLLLEAILRAADRGVRVRMLIDNLTLKKSDETWSILNKHKNIELRVFNPFATYDQSCFDRIGSLFTDFERYTKRMHNKLFIADNQISITGGRNLGDAYFDSNHEFNFRDMDILAAGPITASMSKNFDSYWNGEQAYPFDVLKPPKANQASVSELQEILHDHWKRKVEEGDVPLGNPLNEQLASGELPLTWAKVEMAADMPNKIEQPADEAVSKPEAKLKQLVDQAQHEFIVVSPYFVPGDEGVAWFKQLVDRGIKVRVLTNSLGATDVVAVHSGYRRYREAVLNDGVELYEMKPIPGKHPRAGRFASSSRASLHTKIYVIDRKHIVIGSFNFDPRSIERNTELALVIHSETLAANVIKLFERAIEPSTSYHLVLQGKDRSLEWITEKDSEEVHYTRDPDAGLWRNIESALFGLLPFENQL